MSARHHRRALGIGPRAHAPAALALAALLLTALGAIHPGLAHTINSKSTSTTNLSVGGIATYTINVSSAGQGIASSGMTTVDTLPPGFAYRATRSISLINGATYDGSVVPTPGSTTPQWGLFTNPNPSPTAGDPVSSYSITFDADVLNPICASNVTNSANTLGGTQHALLIPATNTAPLNITGPVPAMTVTKSTSTAVLVNSGSGLQATYTIVVSNAGGTCAATGVNIADTLPAGFSYASTGTIAYTGSPASASRPSGANPTVGDASPVWSGFVVPAGTSVRLTFTANIANGTANGTYNNSASATAAETGATVGNFGPGAAVQLVAASLAKTFAPTSIAVGGTSTLTFTITKPAGAIAAGLAFTEALPANVTISGTPVAAQCGGTVSSTATSLSLSGATIATASRSCSIAATVTSSTPGVYANTSSNISGLSGTLSAAGLSATLTVSNAALSKAFLTSPIGPGGTSVMRFTINNRSAAAHSGMGFNETLPANVTVVPGFAPAQCGGTVSSSAAPNVTVSGARVPANASCTIDVTVTASVPGTYVNGAAQISALTGGLTADGLSATLRVGGTLLTKSFNPNSIGVNGISTLTFTINNSTGAPAQSALAFTETLPANVSVVPGFTPLQCGGTVTSSGTQNIRFSGGTLAAGVGQCTLSIDVTSALIGTYSNTAAQISAASGGMDTSGVNAALTVGNVILTKDFATSPVGTGTSLILTFTLTNSTGSPAQSGLAFTDTFPVGLTLFDATATFGPGCTGTLTDSSGAALAAGGPGLALSAGALAIGTASCTIAVNVTSATPGTYINDATRISAASPGLGAASLSATAQFSGAALAVTKTTSTSTVDMLGTANGVAIYTIRIVNSGNAPADGIILTDTLPGGFTYASTGTITLSGGATRSSPASPALGDTAPAWSTFSIPGAAAVVLTFSASIANATASGTYHNSAGVTTTTEGSGISNYDGALPANTGEDVTLRRLADLTLAKAQVTPNPVAQGQSGVQFSLTVNNIGAAPKASPNVVTVTDNAPAGMTLTAMSGLGWSCSVPTCTRSDALANGASYPPINVIVSIAANAAASLTNSSTVALSGQPESSTNNNTGNAPPTTVNPNAMLSKVSSPNPIGAGGVSTLTFTLTNGQGNPAQSGLAFTDTLPANVRVANPANMVNACGGSVSAAPGGASIALSGATLSAGTPSCTLSVNITSALPGSYANTAGNVSGLGGALSASAVNDTLVVRGTALSKAFSPATVGVAQVSMLTFTVSNSSGNPPQSGLAFTDTFPAGLVLATPAGPSNGCGGTVGAAAGSNSVSLTGGTLAAGAANCTITVNVLGNAAGTYVNNAGNLSGAAGGLATGGVAATLVVLSPLTVTKAFSPTGIAVNGTSVLTITLTNGNAVAVTGAAFTDTYPGGLVNTASASPATTCTGTGPVTLTGANGAGSLALSGADVAANSSCLVTVNVSSATAGIYANTTGSVSTANAGIGAAANAVLGVQSKPRITKSFNPTSMAANGSSTLSLAITNLGTTALTGVSFSDTFPAGLIVAPAPALTNNCGGSIAAGAAGNSSVGLSGGTLAGSATCSITLAVTAAGAGSYDNTANGVSSNQTGSAGAASNVATLTVVGRPAIAKAFSPTVIGANGSSTLTFTFTNTSAVAQTGVAFSDTFPSGLLTATTPALANGCGGTVSGATAGGNSLSLAGASIPASGSCTLSLSVTALATGTYNNVSSTVSSSNGGNGNSAAASLTVSANPSISKAFTPAIVPAGATSTLTFVLGNSAAVPALNAGFTDSLPSGMSVAAPAASSNTCGGTLSAAAASTSIALSGATIPGTGNCTATVKVAVASAGSYANTASAVSSLLGNGNPSNTATLIATAPLSIAKNFNPSTIVANGSSTLSFTLNNANAVPITGASFSDTFPSGGLQVAPTPNLTNSCGGTVSGASPTSTGLSWVNGTLGPGATCTLTVVVTSPVPASFSNTTSGVSSDQTGTGTPATATLLTVLAPDLRVSKSHGGNFTVGSVGTYTLVVDNILGSAPTSGSITVTDILPTGLSYQAVGSGGGAWSCSAGISIICSSSAVIAAGASAGPLTLNVNVAASAIPTVTNRASVSGGNEPAVNGGNNAATDAAYVVAAPQNTFAPDGAQAALPGTTVFYAHTFQAGLAGSVAFASANAPNPGLAGWSNTLYRDTNCNGVLDGTEGNATLSNPTATTPGNGICLLVKEFVPAGAPLNARDVITLSAAFTPASGGAMVNYARTDITTVGNAGGAGLTLQKSVRNVTSGTLAGTSNTALPGETLEYTLTYTNQGADPLQAIIVNDATPAFTTFVSANCPATPPPNITACNVSTRPAVGGAGAIAWTLTGALAPGASGTVVYRVQL